MSTFDQAFTFVVGEEGGYVANPADPGGATKYGISQRAYPNVDIPNLTLDAAKAIYKRDYWDALHLDSEPYAHALCLFDCAVNQGVSRARQIAQTVQTSPFVVNFQAERMLHYASLPTFVTFGRGWSRRLLRTAIEATNGVLT
jgi:lysozyme family protein